MFRAVTRIGVALTIALTASLLFLYFTPWSSGRTDRWIQSQLQRMTGLQVDFNHCVFRLSDGVIEVYQPRLVDPEEGNDLLALTRFEIAFTWDALFQRERTLCLQRIVGYGPLELELGVGAQGIILNPEQERLVAILRQRVGQEARQVSRPKNRQSPLRLAIERVRLEGVDLRLMEQSPERKREIVMISQTGLELIFDETLKPQQIFIESHSEKSEEVEMDLVVRPDWDQRGANVALHLSRFDARELFEGNLGQPFVLRPLTIQGDIFLGNNGRWRYWCEGQTDQLELHVSEVRRDPQQLGAGEITLAGEIDPSSATLTLEQGMLNFDWGTLRMHGSLGWRAPWRYLCEIDDSLLRDRGIDLLLENISAAEKLPGARPGRISLQSRVSGTLQSRRPESIGGRLEVADLDLQTQFLPLPIQALSGELTLTTQTVVIEDGGAIIQGLPLAIQGAIDGDIATGRLDRMALAWRVRGQTDGMSDLLRMHGGTALADYTIKGDVEGQGFVRAERVSDARWFKALGRYDWGGSIDFDQWSLMHTDWSDPVSVERGGMAITPRRLVFNDLLVATGASEVQLSAELAGPEAFWRDAHLQARSRGQLDWLDARNWQQYIPVPLHPVVDRISRGRMRWQARADLDLTAWQQANWLASVQWEDCLTTLSLPHAQVPLHIASSELLLTSDSLQLNDLTATLEGMPIQLRAAASGGVGALDASLQGEMPALRQALPTLLWRFPNADGKAATTHRLALNLRPGGQDFERWFDWIGWAMERHRTGDLVELLREHPWLSDWQGEVDLRETEMTYFYMPSQMWVDEAHAEHDRKGLRTTEFGKMRVGSAQDPMLGNIELLYPTESNPFTLKFALDGARFDFNEWVLGWGPPEGFVWPSFLKRSSHSGPHRYDPDAKVNFHLEGTVDSDLAEYWRIEAEDFHGMIDLDVTAGGASDVFRWKDVVFEAFDGHAAMDGYMHGDEILFLLDLDDVQLKPFLKAMLKTEGIFGIDEGRLTGSLELRWDRTLADTPYVGSGHIQLSDIHFISNPIFSEVAQALSIPIFKDITFHEISGDYHIQDRKIFLDDLKFGHPVMDLVASGTVGTDRSLDLTLTVEWFKIVEDVPLLAQTMDLINTLAGKVMRIRVKGTFDDPDLTLL